MASNWTTFTCHLRDGATDLNLRAVDWTLGGIFLVSLDLGFPAVREVVSEAPGRDGVLDYTTFVGARTVSATLKVKSGLTVTVNQYLDQLRAISAPNKRVAMEVTREGWTAPRRLWLRPNAFTCVINKTSHIAADVNMAWSAYDAVMESTVLTPYDISPIFESTGFSLTPGAVGSPALALLVGDSPAVALVLTPGTGQNIQLVTNLGTAPAYPTYTIVGQCDNPQIINRTTGKRLVFNKFSVPAGTSVVVDVAKRTAVASTGQSVARYINWGSSTWFTLPVGATTLEFETSGAAVGCVLHVTFPARYL